MLVDAGDRITWQRIISCAEPYKSFKYRIEMSQPGLGSKPEFSIAVFKNQFCPSVCQALLIARFRSVNMKIPTIIFVQPILRTKPHESLRILVDGIDRTKRETVIDSDAIKSNVIELRWRIKVRKQK